MIGKEELTKALETSSIAMGYREGENTPLDPEHVLTMLDEEGINADELREYVQWEVESLSRLPLLSLLLQVTPEAVLASLWLMGFCRAWFVAKKKFDPLEREFSNE